MPNLHSEGRPAASRRPLRGLFALYQARLIFSWAHLLLAALAVPSTVALAQQYQGQDWRSFYAVLEPLLPPLGGTLLVPLLLKEQQQRTLVLMSVTQRSLQSVFLTRLVLTLLFLTGLVGIFSLGPALASLTPPSGLAPASLRPDPELVIWPTEVLGGPHGFVAILLTLGAPTLFLGGLGTFLAHVFADARAGYLVIFTLWMFNRMASNMAEHPVLRHIYLFGRSIMFQMPHLDSAGGWLAPKLVQVGLGALFLALSWWLLRKPDRFLRVP